MSQLKRACELCDEIMSQQEYNEHIKSICLKREQLEYLIPFAKRTIRTIKHPRTEKEYYSRFYSSGQTLILFIVKKNIDLLYELVKYDKSHNKDLQETIKLYTELKKSAS